MIENNDCSPYVIMRRVVHPTKLKGGYHVVVPKFLDSGNSRLYSIVCNRAENCGACPVTGCIGYQIANTDPKEKPGDSLVNLDSHFQDKTSKLIHELTKMK